MIAVERVPSPGVRHAVAGGPRPTQELRAGRRCCTGSTSASTGGRQGVHHRAERLGQDRYLGRFTTERDPHRRVGPRVRILLPPAGSLQTLGPSSQMRQKRTPGSRRAYEGPNHLQSSALSSSCALRGLSCISTTPLSSPGP
jgi:hypothetical protein